VTRKSLLLGTQNETADDFNFAAAATTKTTKRLRRQLAYLCDAVFVCATLAFRLLLLPPQTHDLGAASCFAAAFA